MYNLFEHRKKRAPQPSTMGRQVKRVPFATTAPKPPSVGFIHVKSTLRSSSSPSVLLIQGEGYAEKVITDPVYERDRHDVYKAFCDALMPFEKIVNPVQNGEFVTKTVVWKGELRTFRRKCIAVPANNNSDFNPGSDIRKWLDNTFLPSFYTLNFKGSSMDRDMTFRLSDPPYKTVETMSDCISDAAIEDIVGSFYGASTKLGISNFFKANKENLYTCWHPGQVPLRIISAYDLKAQHVDALDWERYETNLLHWPSHDPRSSTDFAAAFPPSTESAGSLDGCGSPERVSEPVPHTSAPSPTPSTVHKANALKLDSPKNHIVKPIVTTVDSGDTTEEEENCL